MFNFLNLVFKDHIKELTNQYHVYTNYALTMPLKDLYITTLIRIFRYAETTITVKIIFLVCSSYLLSLVVRLT